MSLSLLATFVKKLGGNAQDSVIKTIVSWDPETATEAEIEERQKDVKRASEEFSKAYDEFLREKQEYEAAQKKYNTKMAAAELLQKQLEDPEMASDQRSAKEAALTKLICELEEMAPEVDRERQEAEDAKKFADILKNDLEGLGKDLTTARQNLDKAKREMQQAEKEEERAARQAERMEVMTGIKNKERKIDTALQAMQSKAAESKMKARAAMARTEAIAPACASTEDDPVIAEALREVEGKPDASKLSLSERLASLKK